MLYASRWIAAIILHPKTHSLDIFYKLYDDADFSVSARVKIGEQYYPEFREKNDCPDTALEKLAANIDKKLINYVTMADEADSPIDTFDETVFAALDRLLLHSEFRSLSIYGESSNDMLRYVVVIRLADGTEIRRAVGGMMDNLRDALAFTSRQIFF